MSQVEQAAERIVERWNKFPDCYPDGETTAAYEVARAWLAEHPADDGEPICNMFLRRCGFKGDAAMEKYGPGMWLGDIKISHGWEWSWKLEPWPFKRIETRGDLRRLFSVLGLTPTNSQDTSPSAPSPHRHSDPLASASE